MIQIIVGQFCDVQGEVFFRREDVVSFSVIIHKNSLVACHLSAFKVALHVKSLSHGFLPLCRPISQTLFYQRIERGYIGGNENLPGLARPERRKRYGPVTTSLTATP